LAFIAAVAAGYSVYEAIVGAPIPSRHSGFLEKYFREHGPNTESAYSYFWFALAVTFLSVCVTLIVITVRPLGYDRIVPPWGLAPPQIVAWLIALILMVARWLRGDHFSNYTPPGIDLIEYIGSVVIIGIVLSLLVALRVRRERELRRARRLKSNLGRVPRW
jgi:purine-cytosine permease-like protein